MHKASEPSSIVDPRSAETPRPGPWRIAHAESSLGWGGQERRTLAELTGFRHRGSEVWMIAPLNARITQQARQCGIPCEPLRLGRLWFPLEVVRLSRWLKRHRIQILNPHSSKDGWLLGLAGRLARTPLIIRSRHFDVPFGHHGLSRWVYTRLADHLVTTSPRITAKLQEAFHLPHSRVTTVSTGIDLKRFCPEGPRVLWPFEAAVAPGQARIPKVGMVGIFRRAKGHATLLDAAALLRKQGFKAHYVLVGDGPMVPLTRQKTEELGLVQDVFFSGEREDVPEVLRSLDLLLMPSLHEGIPQVGLQALACGTPMIASDVGGLPSIIKPGQTGRLVPPENPEALAQAIREALMQPEETARWAREGRKLVEREHGLEQMLDRMTALYVQHGLG